MSSKRTIIIGAVILLAVAAVAYYWRKNPTIEKPPAAIGGQEGESSTSSAPITVGVQGSGEYTVEQVPLPPQSSFPPLRRTITFPAAFSDEAREIMRSKIEASIAVLEKNPRDFGEWTVLAMHRNLIDDYEGARQVWEFLITTNPDQPAPYANLASLYAFELKDPVRAEKNFTVALKLWSKDVSVWRNAYDFYRYVQKDNEKAKEILRKGIAETDSQDLQYLLDHYAEL